MASSSAENTESFLDILRAGVDDDRKPELVAHLFLLPSAESQGPPQNAIEEARLFFQKQSQGYVWHTGHPPTIEAPSPCSGSASPLLTLRLETPVATPDTDEWFSLHLLVCFATSFSSQAQRHRYAIQTTDSDGDFLLIQGADELPDWIEPSNASNRVWLLPSLQAQQSPAKAQSTIYPFANLHLIGPDLAVLPPEDASDRNSSAELSVAQALQILSENTHNCQASRALQSAALGPMVEFATTTADGGFVSAHTALAYLPSADVAALLQNHPQLGAQALGALDGLSADQIDRRVLSRMERFGHVLQDDSLLVLAPVSLTKALYALALHLVFFPPKPQFPQAWRDGVASFRGAEQDQQASSRNRTADQTTGPKITEINEASERRRHEVEEKQARSVAEGRWRDIGAKLVCGLELLYARGRSRSRTMKSSSGSAPREGLAQVSLEETYLLQNIPDLIDLFVPLPPSQSAYQRGRSGSRQAERSSPIIVDQSADLQALFARESSTEWLTQLMESGIEPADQGVAIRAHGQNDSEAPDEEDDAFSRLQRLVQGTTDFLNDEDADYRGAIFDGEDNNMDESDQDEGQPDVEDGADVDSGLEPQHQDQDVQSDISTDSNDADLEAGTHPGITDEAEEMASFLSFARNELGIDDELWEKIQADRRKDGRYVPPPLSGNAAQAGSSNKGNRGLDDDPDALSSDVKGSRPSEAKKVRFDGLTKGFLNDKKSKRNASSSRAYADTLVTEPPSHQKKRSSLWDVPAEDDDEEDTDMYSADGRRASGSNVQDDDDDGFYEMLDRMDAELARAQRAKAQQDGTQSQKAAGKRRDTSRPGSANDRQATVEEEEKDDDDDDERGEGDSDEELDLQDAELLRKLVSAQGEALLGRRSGGPAQTGESQLDDLNAGMLANLLESIRAQGGAPGPVSNLAGRLGIGRLPRDDDDA